LSYAWVSGGTTLATAATYTVAETDEGNTITLSVTDTADFSGGSATASATSASVIDQTPSISVSIGGTAQEGQVLAAIVSGHEADDTLSYAWVSGGTTLGTASTYTVAETDEGNTITLSVTDTADFSGGSATASATSASVIGRAPSISS